MAIDKDVLRTVFLNEGFDISNEQAERFSLYAELLVEKNKVMNLTAITNPYDIVVKHFLDSCMAFKTEEIRESARVIDIGTGAGFPLLPMKILRPDLNICLLDSLNKRVNFLLEVTKALGFAEGCECVHMRAEEGAKTKLRESFDYAVARAVSNLSVLCEYCLPYVKIDGRFLAYKGFDCETEYSDSENAALLLGGRLDGIEKYRLPNGDGRAICRYLKAKHTDMKYPRAGNIAKKPL